MVADALVYHPTVAHYLRFVGTTLGRDKVLRTLQFLARFLSWYLYRKGYSASAIQPWEAMKKQFASARKVMRLGKNVEHFKAASQAIDAKSGDAVVNYFNAGRQLGYAGYLTLDSIVFLDSAGIYKFESSKTMQRQAFRFWLFGLAMSAMNGLYKVRKLREREEKVKKTEAEGKVEGETIVKEKKAAQLQLLSDMCDLTIPTSALGYINFDDGFVGLAGLVSSIIGLRAAWQKTA